MTDSSTTINTFPPMEDPTPKELSSEYDQFIEVINQLDTVKTSFTKIDLSSLKILSDGRTEEYVLSSSNTSTISQWIDLLTDMKITAIPYASVSGTGYSLCFYSPEEAISVGGIVGRYIYLPVSHGEKVTMYIDNYDELRPRFLALEKEMGFPAAE